MSLTYPETRRGDVVDDYFGTAVADPYRWLEDGASAETASWIAAQNALTRSWLDEVRARPAIRDRLAALWDHPRRGVPWRRGDRWFQLRNDGLQDQDVLWTMDGPQDEGRVLVDPNEGDAAVALAATAVSRDGSTLAFALSEAGSDWMTWHVLDVATGRVRPDERLGWAKFSGAAWAPDGSGFFYARYDPPPPGEELAAANRHHKLCFHRLGTPQADDVVVYERPDEPEWGFSPDVTEDGRHLVVDVWQGTDHRNRVVYADVTGFSADRPGDLAFVELLMAFDAGYAFVGSVGDAFLFRTDRDAPRGRLVAVDLADPQPASWRELIAEEPESTLEGAVLCGGHLVALSLDHARHRLTRHALDGTQEARIPLPDLGTVAGWSARPDDPVLHFAFETFTVPSAVYRHDVTTGATALVTPPGLSMDPAAFETEQVFVSSADGTRVPMFLVRRADLPHPRDGEPVDVPTLLYGYGGFGISVTPAFSVSWAVWLELGGQLAVANLRGGGEYGEEWHAAGRGPRKQQVFDDFVACAEALVDSGWTTRARLAATGGSNGGLLVGACMTQRPDLFGACVPEVGVLDMLRFHRFTIGWAWASEYGSAEDPEQFKVLLAYSPLHNVWPRTRYPATLVVTGDHDDRVVPAHSFKFAAALQAAQSGLAPILIRVQTDVGHGAGKPTQVSIEERADVLAFLVRALEMEEPR